MDHRPLINALVFLFFMVSTIYFGVALAAEPVKMWASSTYPNNYFTDPLDAAYYHCGETVYPANLIWSGVAGTVAMNEWSGELYCTVNTRSTGQYYFNYRYPMGASLRCELDGSAPINGVCPDPPEPCPTESLVNLSRTGTGTAPDPICFGGCEYTSSPLTLYLPLVDQYYADYYATGQQCTEADDNNPSTTPPVYRDPPVTQTDVSAPIVGVDQSGNPQTTQETVTTTTTDPGITTSTETEIVEVGTDTVVRETTTTVTTYPDGSMETVVQTTYTNTTAEKNIYDLIANTVNNQPSSVTTGTRTTSTTINPDGSSTSTTTQTGTPYGTGEGEGEGEEPCGYFVPQFICDFFSDDTPAPEHDAMPVTEVGEEFVTWSSGLSSGTCPSSVSASFMGQSFAYDYTDACYAAETFFRPILLAIAAIVAAMIIVGARL